MEDIESKSTNELLFELKQLEADYEAVKLKVFSGLDEMDSIEERYNKINRLIVKRLKPNYE